MRCCLSTTFSSNLPLGKVFSFPCTIWLLTHRSFFRGNDDLCFRENENRCFNKYRKGAFLAQLCRARVFPFTKASVVRYFCLVRVLTLHYRVRKAAFSTYLLCLMKNLNRRAVKSGVIRPPLIYDQVNFLFLPAICVALRT